ncbi:MAG: MaoC family dehydratase [Acidobacteria bacterium]|nr:MaoC family dehydratase [Acidobacteriota bacterium]
MSEFDPKSAKAVHKGNAFEDFEVGQVFEHHWGRTFNQGDNSLFTTTTLFFNPLYFNVEYARAEGHPDVLICPMLLLSTVVGLSVEDLSEGGGPFLGVDELTFHRPVYPGDTVRARSTVAGHRLSGRRPAFGIVTWHTEAFNQHDVRVLDYKRSNLIGRRRRAEKGDRR